MPRSLKIKIESVTETSLLRRELQKKIRILVE